VPQIGADLKCHNGDHAFEDNVAGWGFCYPATWKYNLRAQSVVSPPELDLVFDITDVPCTTPSVPAGQTARPVCATNAGLFGLMVVYTYERGEATSLSQWIQSNTNPAPSPGETISWGNAKEAMKLTSPPNRADADPRRDPRAAFRRGQPRPRGRDGPAPRYLEISYLEIPGC